MDSNRAVLFEIAGNWVPVLRGATFGDFVCKFSLHFFAPLYQVSGEVRNARRIWANTPQNLASSLIPFQCPVSDVVSKMCIGELNSGNALVRLLNRIV